MTVADTTGAVLPGVTVELTGQETHSAVTVATGASVPLRVTLGVAGLASSVEVTAETPVIDPKGEANLVVNDNVFLTVRRTATSTTGRRRRSRPTATTSGGIYFYDVIDSNANMVIDPEELAGRTCSNADPSCQPYLFDINNPNALDGPIHTVADFKTPTTHEFQLGLDRELLTNVGVSGTFTYRTVHELHVAQQRRDG